VEPDAAFRRSPGIIVLNTETIKDFDGPIIHADRDLKSELPHRTAEHRTNLRVQVQEFSHMVELGLSHFISVNLFSHLFDLLHDYLNDRRVPGTGTRHLY
jgi:hypothetical protein